MKPEERCLGVGFDDPCGPFQLRIFYDSTTKRQE